MTKMSESQEENTAQSPFSSILIYVDGSEASMEALRMGIRIASTHQIPVTALSVIEERVVAEVAAISGTKRRNLCAGKWRLKIGIISNMQINWLIVKV